MHAEGSEFKLAILEITAVHFHETAVVPTGREPLNMIMTQDKIKVEQLREK
jgi:hypothetical protein